MPPSTSSNVCETTDRTVLLQASCGIIFLYDRIYHSRVTLGVRLVDVFILDWDHILKIELPMDRNLSIFPHNLVRLILI